MRMRFVNLLYFGGMPLARTGFCAGISNGRDQVGVDGFAARSAPRIGARMNAMPRGHWSNRHRAALHLFDGQHIAIRKLQCIFVFEQLGIKIHFLV